MKRRSIITLLILLIVGFAVLAGSLGLFSSGKPVEVIKPHRGTIRESFREQARTRLQNTWQISTQVSGRINRIELEPGDRVKKGQELAEFDLVPLRAALAEAEASVAQLKAMLAVKDDNTLEETALSESREMAKSAEESVRSGEARVESDKARVTYTQKEYERIQKLADSGTVSASARDESRLNADTAKLELSRAGSDLASLRATLAADKLEARRLEETITRKKIERQELVARIDQAESVRDRARHDLELAKVVSPIDGVVLERAERGERPLIIGTQLVLLGNPAEMEVIADVLTEDALRLPPGGEVALESEPSDLHLKGKVKRIEPQGFTKLSSLGVEQQRVNVIMGMEEVPPQLGIGFRLHARFFTASKENALIVPRFAVMQAPDQSFYVLTISGGKLKRQPVKLGLRSDLEIEIAEGPDESAEIVAAPDSTMEQGQAVRAVLQGS